MLSIGNKKYRNLQEQVGFNTEQIEKIFDVLDGLAVTDNVVAIADLSDNLNENQLEIVQKSVAFLIYDGQLYIKKSEDASNAYFDIVFTISVSGGVISFNSKEIEVDLATGALSQTTSTNSTYSSTQIDSLLSAKASITYVDTQLALKASLAGANFTGAITAPSIIENMTSYTFTPALSTANKEINVIYAGAVKNGNKLTLVIFETIEMKNAISTTMDIGTFSVPQAVFDKLYPFTIESNSMIAINTTRVWETFSSYVDTYFFINKGSGTNLVFNTPSGVLTPNKVYLFRCEVTFLLSDSLAS